MGGSPLGVDGKHTGHPAETFFSLFLFGFSACALLADENSADPVCRKSDKIFSSQWQTISPSATWLRGWPLNSLWRGGCQNRQGSHSPHRAMPAPQVFWSPARLHGDPSTQFSSWVVCPSPFPQAPLNVLSRLFSGIASMQLCFCSTGEPADLGAGCRAQIEEDSSGKRDKVMPTAGDTEGHMQILPGNSQKVQMPEFTGVQKHSFIQALRKKGPSLLDPGHMGSCFQDWRGSSR